MNHSLTKFTVQRTKKKDRKIIVRRQCYIINKWFVKVLKLENKKSVSLCSYTHVNLRCYRRCNVHAVKRNSEVFPSLELSANWDFAGFRINKGCNPHKKFQIVQLTSTVLGHQITPRPCRSMSESINDNARNVNLENDIIFSRKRWTKDKIK